MRLWRSCGLWACHRDFWHNALFYCDRYTAVMPRCHPLTDPSTRRLYINPRVPAAQTRMPIRAQRRDNTSRGTRALICRCVCIRIHVHTAVWEFLLFICRCVLRHFAWKTAKYSITVQALRRSTDMPVISRRRLIECGDYTFKLLLITF